jgi:hypothetical protein
MPSTHPAFEEVVAGRSDWRQDQVKRLIDLPSVIADFTQGLVQVVDRVLFLNKAARHERHAPRPPVHGSGPAGARQPLIAFIEKVSENPSRRAVHGLYDWAEKSGLPITPEGTSSPGRSSRRTIRTSTRGRSTTRSARSSRCRATRSTRIRTDLQPRPARLLDRYLPHYGTAPAPRHGRQGRPEGLRRDAEGLQLLQGARLPLRGDRRDAAREGEDLFPRPVRLRARHRSGYRSGELDLDLTSFYRTRDGQKVEIQDYDEQGETYPYSGGSSAATALVECWTYDGVYTDARRRARARPGRGGRRGRSRPRAAGVVKAESASAIGSPASSSGD